MPQIFKIGPYIIFFWSNENEPIEPIHVHISENTPSVNATKIWITKTGKTLLCNNNSRIPEKDLRNLLRIIEANSSEISSKWYDFFGEISYYC